MGRVKPSVLRSINGNLVQLQPPCVILLAKRRLLAHSKQLNSDIL
jgi:hypothetical protein